MINLYDIDDGLKILEKKKKIVLYFILSGLFLVAIMSVITALSHGYFIMFLDIILSTIYLWALYTYVFYFRKMYNEMYHFLAKVEQYEHEIISGVIDEIEDDITTIKNMETYLVSIAGRIVYIECDKKAESFKIGATMNVEVVDNFVVGYEVI